MRVHEDVSFNPGISAVEIEMIIGSAIKDVVNDLEDRTGAIAPGEVDGVVEAPGVAKIVVAENAVAPIRNSVHAMEHFRAGRTRISGKIAVLNNE